MCGWPCRMGSCRRWASRGYRLPLPAWVNFHIEFAYAIVRQGQSFRLACPCGQATEGLKTPGY